MFDRVTLNDVRPWVLPDSDLDQIQHHRLVGAVSYTPARVGDRLSHRFGLGYDFADFKCYQPGDRIQHIDWKRYNLTGGKEIFVRKFFEELSSENLVILDASASMVGFPEDVKFEVASRIARLLLCISLACYEPADVVILGGRGHPDLERDGFVIRQGLRTEFDLETFVDEMRSIEAMDHGGLAELPRVESELRRHYGAIVLISDGFEDPDIIERMLDSLCVRSTRMHFIQLAGIRDLRPFKHARDVEWRDLETGQRLTVGFDPAAHEEYVKKKVLEPTKDIADHLGANYMRLACLGTEDQPLLNDPDWADWTFFSWESSQTADTDLISALVDGEVLEEV